MKFQRPRVMYLSICFPWNTQDNIDIYREGKMTGLWIIWSNWTKVLASCGMFNDVSVPKCTKTVFQLRIGPLRVGGGCGCEVSCGGHRRLRGKTTTGSTLDGAVFDITQILAYSSTQYEQIPIILGVWPFWLTPFFFRSITFWRANG